VHAYADRVAGADIVARPHGAAVLPGRDGVAAREHLEGAERLEAAGGTLHRRAAPLERGFPRRRETVAESRELRTLARHDRPRVQVRQALLYAPQRRALALRRAADADRDAGGEVVERLLMCGNGQARIAQSSRDAHHRDVVMAQARVHRAREMHLGASEKLALRAAIRHDELGGLRRRGGPGVGGEVDESHVDVVPDRAHDRDPARSDGSHDRLVVERAEVVGGSAAAPDDDHVDVPDALQLRQRVADRLGGGRPLDVRGCEQDACPSPAKRDPADVVDDGAGAAGHDPDRARLAREGPLAFLGEQTFGRELRPQTLERLEQGPAADRLHAIDDELESAAWGPERRLATQPDTRPIDGELAHPGGEVRAVHDRVDHRVFALVLQAKVQVPAGRRTRVRHLAFDPHRADERVVNRRADGPVELGDCERSRFRVRGLRRPRREVEGQAAILGHESGFSTSGAWPDAGVRVLPNGDNVAAIFRKVLIANRGEIAVRVARTLREMGIRVVAVYSDVDRASLHVRMADEAHPIGPARATESYLRIDRIVDVARKTGCDAIHPGYGFLSENPALPEACERAGIAFIGPPAGAMRTMGNKTSARDAMAAAGVPIVPGARCDTATEALEAARKIGFPVMLKAAAGGGGKGMRLVAGAGEMASAWDRARSEAQKFFGDDTVYLEKVIARPRHVEIQVLGDRDGNVVHLFERDCSIQRRNQKVVEETPGPGASPDQVARMGAIAVRGAQSVGYFSAGTFEFLVSETGDFYFLEMNTRLQVEHPITELVTGLDLVREMVRVAQGEALAFDQDGVTRRGAAIECRVYAEDPVTFLPSPGVIGTLVTPAGPGVRDDSGAYPGCSISSYYDPLISKLSVWASTREAAIARMRRALSEYVITGIRTNLAFHDRLLSHPEFCAGRYDTGFIERHRQHLLTAAPEAREGDDALAVALAVGAARVDRTATSAREAARRSGSSLSPWVAHHRARLTRLGRG
jgi:acetyl-CoA carboxylase biotin carboxylase subunit